MVSLSALKIYEADFLKYDTFVKSSLVILMIVIFLQSSKKLAHNNASRQKDAKKSTLKGSSEKLSAGKRGEAFAN